MKNVKETRILRKFVCTFLVCIMLCNTMLVANADALYKRKVNYGNNMNNGVNEYNIDKLYEERLKLCSDFEANSEKIAAIDAKLEQLGVRELTEDEIIQKCYGQAQTINGENSVMPLYSWIPEEDGIKWTSRTYIQVDRGQLFEIEEIRGVEDNNSGKLTEYYDEIDLEATVNNVSATKTIIKGIATLSAGLIPGNTGLLLSSGITIYDTIKSLAGVSRSTIIRNAKISTYIRAQNDIVILYVKRYGDSEKNKVLMYKGNHIKYDTTVCVPLLSSTPIGVEYNIDKYFDTSDVYSPYYDSKAYKAIQNLRTYEENKYYSITTNYYMSLLKIKYIDGKTYNLQVPSSDYIF